MENLEDLVKKVQTEPVVFTEESVPVVEESTEEVPEAIVETEPDPDQNVILVTSLLPWFDNNVGNFTNIRKATISIQGVDANEQLIITIPQPTEENPDKRKLIVFDSIEEIAVLNIPAFDMQIFNNSYRILYELGNGIFIKGYGLRNNMIAVFCIDVDDILIPFNVSKVKMKDGSITIPNAPDIVAIRQRLTEPLDMESLIIQYKQSSRVEGLMVKQDAVKWLLDKQGSVYDVNHHLQIDNVIMNLVV